MSVYEQGVAGMTQLWREKRGKHDPYENLHEYAISDNQLPMSEVAEVSEF